MQKKLYLNESCITLLRAVVSANMRANSPSSSTSVPLESHLKLLRNGCKEAKIKRQFSVLTENNKKLIYMYMYINIKGLWCVCGGVSGPICNFPHK